VRLSKEVQRSQFEMKVGH